MTFDYLSWEAFATLVTGALAVGAAIYVGRKQSEIQNRLASIEELKLRQALFEDRIEVYDATRAFLGWISAHAEVPGLARRTVGKRRHTSERIRRDFTDAVDRSRFLFRPSVSQGLNGIWESARLAAYHQKKQADLNGKERGTHVDAENAALIELNSAYLDLASIFGDELTLSAYGATFAPKPTIDEPAQTQ